MQMTNCWEPIIIWRISQLQHVYSNSMKIIKDELFANDQLLGTNHFLSVNHKHLNDLIDLIYFLNQ